MNFNLENISEQFISFLSTLNKFQERKLISFAFEVENFDNLLFINNISQHFDDLFFFRNPNNKNSFLGINSALELVSDDADKFSETFNNYSIWKNNFISNREVILQPLKSILCCTAKFDPSKTYSLWSDFKSLRIYIPEIVFLSKDNEVTAYFNFLSDDEKSFNDKLEQLTNYLSIISKQNTFVINSQAKQSSAIQEKNEDQFNSWNDIVTEVLEVLKNGRMQKIVLSRVHKLELKSKINWNELLEKLYKRFPDCYLFFVKKNESIFFGSSPEMFLKVKDKTAEVESVAGSAPRGDKSESDNELEKYLKSSDKNHLEHLFVSDFISDILIQYSNDVRIIEEKQIRKLDNIQHLITKISAELNSKDNLFELIDSLFPTPAVCGVPKDTAMSLIRSLETHDRGLYSGLVGVFDFDGNCELAVSIRSALVKGNQLTAFAGAGLLKNSDPQEEFSETALKLNTILSLFENENKS